MAGRRTLFALLTLATTASAVGAPTRVSGSGASAVGVDDNLNGSPVAGEAVGDLFVQGNAAVALTGGPLTSTRSLALAWRGRAYATFTGLSSHTVSVSGLWMGTPKDWVSFTVAPRVSGRWVTDPLLRSVDVGADVGFILRPSDVFSLRGGYDLSQSVAVDPVYSGTLHTGRGAVEVRPARRTFVLVEYTATFGPTVRYEDAPAASGGDGQGDGDRQHTDSTLFADEQVAVRYPSWTHTAVVDVEHGLSERFYVRGLAGVALTRADDADAWAHFAQLSLGVRLP